MDESATPRAKSRGTANNKPAVTPILPTTPVMEVAEFTLLHRYRFVAPLCADRIVMDVAGPEAHRGILADAGLITGPEQTEPAQAVPIVLALAPLPAPAICAALPAWLGRLAPDGVMAITVQGVVDDTLISTLSERFACLTRYSQRPVLGSMIAAAAFTCSRVTTLADAAAAAGAPRADVCEIILCGHVWADLSTGLFEHALPAQRRMPSPALFPATCVTIGSSNTASTPRSITRADAASLVERLMDLDESLVSLAAENRVLQDQSGSARGGGPASRLSSRGVGDEEGPASVSWPLLQNPAVRPDELDAFEQRPDDDVVRAARDGATFLSTHRLLSQDADFSAAVAALNAIQSGLHVVNAGSTAALPDVSVVIPVFGQLAYTLNCLDGLLRHTSRYSVEIIVVDDHSPDDSTLFLSQITSTRTVRTSGNAGFIAACNAGADGARGRFILLLNNDTRPLQGWLDNLICSFDLFPAAGLVGSKMLYPNGKLQEAGGIVWRDGTPWNYGRGNDPNWPGYCYARQADYISGASIAIPADLWRELGGLDPFYAPAYYEDTDIAFRVRASGRQVWYQSTSRVIHYEGKTAGTDVEVGAKAFQSVNERKFFRRWREALGNHRYPGMSVALERERQVVRRAVLLDDTTPTPRQDAGSNYSLLTIRLFVALGYKLSFVPQDNVLFQHGHSTDLQRMGVECAYFPYDVDAGSFLSRRGYLFDVVMVSRRQVLEQVIADCKRYAPRAPILFNTHDLNFLRMQRLAELTNDPAMVVAAEAMQARELALMRQVDCVVTPSAYEAEILSEHLPDIPTRVLPIITDFEGTNVAFIERRDVCFLGGYGHPPNIDAVKFFVADIFPLLKANEPGLRFIIAGANPTPELLALARDDVIVTGMVDDLRDVFDKVRVFVCPLRIGAGAKGKIASAMSYGLPIVSTTIGAEGMGLVDGETVLLADTPAAFAAACLRVYRQRVLWEKLSRSSLALVSRVASPEARKRIFEDAIETAFRHKFGEAP